MTETPHDALFKAAFEKPEHAASLFRGLLPAPVTAAIAWDTMTREDGSFIDADLADRHSDLLFSVQLGDQPALLYLLLEHQSSNDPDMPLRVLVYLVRIWERFRKDHGRREPLPVIVPAVLCHAPGGWTAARRFHEMFGTELADVEGLATLVPDFSLLIEDLAHLADEDIKAKALDALPKLALWAMRDARDAEQLLDSLVFWSEALAEVARMPHGMDALAQVLRYIALVTDDLHLERFRARIHELAPVAEVTAMTIAEQMRREGEAAGLEKGREEGRQEGREEGRAEGRRATLLKLLELKFGEVPPERAAVISAATCENLDRYIERVLTAGTLAAVFE